MENQNRVGKVLLILAGFALVLCIGMVIGGVLVYGAMRIGDWASSRNESGLLERPLQDSFEEDAKHLSEEDLEEFAVPESEAGAIITEVLPDTPAEQAGLQEGDLVVAVDGQRIGPAGNLARLIALYEPGDLVTLTVRSSDQDAREVRVKLGENPDDPEAPYLGVRYQPALSQGLMLQEIPRRGERGMWRQDEIPIPLPEALGQSGVVVMSVTEGSPAASAGLQHGDLIVSLDSEPVGSAEAFSDAIAERQPGDGAVLGVVHAGEQDEVEVEVRLGEHPDQPGRAYLGVTISEGFYHYHGLQEDGQWLDEMPFNWDDLRRWFELQPPSADDGNL